MPKKEEKNEESGSGEPVAKKPKTDQQETVTVKKVKTTWTDYLQWTYMLPPPQKKKNYEEV